MGLIFKLMEGLVSSLFMDKSLSEGDYTFWEIGPYHAALPGPMQLRLKLSGEVIHSVEIEGGFVHRGLEKTLEMCSWQSAIVYANHLDPEGSVFGGLVLCLAVEEIGEIQIPPRAVNIRIILCELCRISVHMNYIIHMARSVGGETLIHYVLREREKILDLFELLTGSRFSPNFFRFGGVHTDVTDGFLERVLEICDLIQIRMKEYNDLFSFNYTFIKRTANVGTISQKRAKEFGITGPNARACGILLDIRKAHPYSGYDRIDFETPLGKGERGQQGDMYDRFLVRLREITQSISILKQATESIPTGPFYSVKIGRQHQVLPGEAYARVESPRGLLGCHITSNGGMYPHRIQFRPPSQAVWAMLPSLLAGLRLGDLPSVLRSLDLCIAEVDR